MGVYIGGMEMPMGGRILIVFPSGRVLEVSADATQDIFREKQALPVPEHGRLIDASEKIRVQMYDDMTEDYHIAEMNIDDLLSQGWVEADAPTIIPAEPPKEERA